MAIFEDYIEIDGQKLTLQFGKFAQLVDTSVYATLGETAVLVTVAIGPESPNLDYVPLSVDYAEKLYAGGLIKGSRWVKREGKPSDEAVIIGRLIDRGIRPLFPKNYRKQVQVIVTLLSIDGINDPAVLSSIATSAALSVSSVPWEGPVSTVRIGYLKASEEKEFEYIINPTESEEEFSDLDLFVTSTKEKVLMIEAKGKMVPEPIIEKAIQIAKEENKKIIDFIEKITKKIGKKKDKILNFFDNSAIFELINKKYKEKLDHILKESAKLSGDENSQLLELATAIYEELEKKFELKDIFNTLIEYNYKKIKNNVLKFKKRVDGRKLDELRKISCEVSVLPRTHGSAIFQRGQTQILSITTLGSLTLEQLIESPEGREAKRYIHHYSDAPYSYGEVGRLAPPSRRAIGHSILAEKAIEPVLPTTDEFPYAIRVVSEILSENGSSSMGSVCASSLSLMDAGVPLKAAVAGVAMGLMSSSDSEYEILTDIVGVEDFAGEMDFKIAGTSEGITAIQLDVKNRGLTDEMIHKTFLAAKKARLAILEEMNRVIARPRKEISKYAPKVVVLTPPLDKIGDIIGPGGKNIRALIAKTQTEINIDEMGRVTISGLDRERVDEAVNFINNITRQVEVGDEFIGVVKRVLQFGILVEYLPGKEGLVHISKMGRYIRNPFAVFKVGQKVHVRVYEIDRMGRTNLQLVNK